MTEDIPTLVPVKNLIPSWPTRRVNDACREGRIPGAVKVGRDWFLPTSDLERVLAPTVPPKATGPTIDEALEDLKRRGVLVPFPTKPKATGKTAA